MHLRTLVILSVLLGTALLATLPLAAQTFTFSNDPLLLEYDPVTGAGSATLTIWNEEVLLPGAPPATVQGWSAALTLDPTRLDTISVTPGEYIESLNGGSGADFFTVGVFADGFTIGCVYSLTGGTTCSYEVRREIARVEIMARPAFFQGNLIGDVALPIGDSPPTATPPVINGVVVGGQTILTGWSLEPITIQPLGLAPHFIRGDANIDGQINVADVVTILNSLFQPNAELPCAVAGDVNDDDQLNIADAIALIEYAFAAGGPPPPAPFPNCGAPPSGGSLDCANSGC